MKAQQTGQSVEYMTNSIVTGLGRKSLLILDNLGLSAAEINEEIAITGDLMKAVANIVDRQLSKAGENYVSAADKAAQKTAELQNRTNGDRASSSSSKICMGELISYG